MKTLDPTQKQPVAYCIPTWARDLQIKANIARIKARVQPIHELRTEPIAVVCYGPSLNDTWEEIKGYKYVITCSGAHKYLVERGIKPTWHLDVDPREHKALLIGPPCPETEYLIAATCHPKLLDCLEGFNVKLWHIFDSSDEGVRTLPASEWALVGGSSAGLRAMTMARFLGFTDLHIYGMDGNEGPSGKHAAAHPNQPAAFYMCTYAGKDYKTTPAMAECARQTFHELDQMIDVKATFHGEGLCQAMAKDYKPNHKKGTPEVGLMKEELISAEYRDLNAKLHASNLAYGVGGAKHAKTVETLMKDNELKSCLDYGAGKGLLAQSLPFPIWEYDPAIPEKAESPRPADLVVCTDVLEHIEPEKLTHVLVDLHRCTKKVGFFVISTVPSKKVLADGRNAHLIQEDKAWWEAKVGALFHIQFCKAVGPNVWMVVTPLAAKVKRILKPVEVAHA